MSREIPLKYSTQLPHFLPNFLKYIFFSAFFLLEFNYFSTVYYYYYNDKTRQLLLKWKFFIINTFLAYKIIELNFVFISFKHGMWLCLQFFLDLKLRVKRKQRMRKKNSNKFFLRIFFFQRMETTNENFFVQQIFSTVVFLFNEWKQTNEKLFFSTNFFNGSFLFNEWKQRMREMFDEMLPAVIIWFIDKSALCPAGKMFIGVQLRPPLKPLGAILPWCYGWVSRDPCFSMLIEYI